MMDTPFSSKTSLNWLKHTHVSTVKRILQKLVIFKAKLKHVQKEEQLSIAQTSRSKSHTPLARDPSMHRITHHHQPLDGLRERAGGLENMSIT